MTWTTVYLVCFLLGFSLSAVSWLTGALHLHLHLPHVGHGHSGGGAPAHSAHGGRGASVHGGSPSPFNFATLTAFLAWFGGAGYLLTRYADVWPLAALLLAIIVGGAGASLVFWFMAKVLWAPDENLDPDDYELVGLLGVISSPIRAGGTGEVLFSQAGARCGAGARSEDGRAIDKGVEVVITRHQNGLVYVRTWTDLAADERST
jgi:membrane protein implicated in regulation of membrane protease activity